MRGQIMKRIVEVDMKYVYHDIIMDIEDSFIGVDINEVYPFSNVLGTYYGNNIINETEYEYFNSILERPLIKNIVMIKNIVNIFIDVQIVLKSIEKKTSYYEELKNIMSNELENELTIMPYEIFLNTCYWHIVREEKRNLTGNKCQLCGSKSGLHTHHNNYINRGKEYKNMNDLVILCKKCHSKYHNKGCK